VRVYTRLCAWKQGNKTSCWRAGDCQKSRWLVVDWWSSEPVKNARD